MHTEAALANVARKNPASKSDERVSRLTLLDRQPVQSALALLWKLHTGLPHQICLGFYFTSLTISSWLLLAGPSCFVPPFTNVVSEGFVLFLFLARISAFSFVLTFTSFLHSHDFITHAWVSLQFSSPSQNTFLISTLMYLTDYWTIPEGYLTCITLNRYEIKALVAHMSKFSWFTPNLRKNTDYSPLCPYSSSYALSQSSHHIWPLLDSIFLKAESVSYLCVLSAWHTVSAQ